MPACDFTTTRGESHYTHVCQVCGRIVRSPRQRVVRECGSAKTTGDDLVAACVHRGERTGQTHDCELCGNRGVKMIVYECALHGVCTVRRWTLIPQKQPERACIRCEDLTLADGSQPLTTHSS